MYKIISRNTQYTGYLVKYRPRPTDGLPSTCMVGSWHTFETPLTHGLQVWFRAKRRRKTCFLDMAQLAATRPSLLLSSASSCGWLRSNDPSRLLRRSCSNSQNLLNTINSFILLLQVERVLWNFCCFQLPYWPLFARPLEAKLISKIWP